MTNEINMVILNIRQWSIDYSWPWAYYGHLILCTNPEATFHNIKNFDVSKLGEKIEVCRELTREEARKIDKREYSSNYTRCWDAGERNTIRFEDRDELTKAGMEAFKELGLDVPFISLMEGKKTSITRTLNENEVNYLVRYTPSAKDWVMYYFSDEADELDREIGEDMIKYYGSIENILKSDMVINMQKEYDRMNLFERDD